MLITAGQTQGRDIRSAQEKIQAVLEAKTWRQQSQGLGQRRAISAWHRLFLLCSSARVAGLTSYNSQGVSVMLAAFLSHVL